MNTIDGAVRLDGRDDLVVALRAAGLDERAHAGLERELRPVRRTGRRRRRRATRRRPARCALPSAIRTASTRLIWPGADADRRRGRCAITIAFERTCFATRQANVRSPHSRSRRRPRRGDGHHVAVLGLRVVVLHEHAAEHAPQVALARVRRAAARASRGCAGSAASRAASTRAVVVAGREQDLDELLGQRLARARRVTGRLTRSRRRTPTAGRTRARSRTRPRSRAAIATPHGFVCLMITQHRQRELARDVARRRRCRRCC